MRNILRITLFVFFASFIVGCAQKGHEKMPVTLDEALQRQKVEPDTAIVLGTVESLGKSNAISEGLGAFLIGKRTVKPAIGFAGNPYGPKPEIFKKLPQDQGAIPIAYGGFSLTEGKDWAYVASRKYALYQFRNHENKMADFRGWGRNDRMAYMVFDVNPGEVIYIGHIKAQFNQGQYINFAVEDRFEEFRNSQPEEIQRRLIKRIIKAPTSIYAEEVM
jgi:hypothetical protein